MTDNKDHKKPLSNRETMFKNTVQVAKQDETVMKLR